MSRIIKNVLPYWKSIVLVFALLIVQAVCDLSLPAYTSDIIDTGIQNGGIEHTVPEKITKEEFDTAKLFMTEEEAQLWEQSYSYNEDDNVYELSVKGSKNKTDLDDTLFTALIINNQMSSVTESAFKSRMAEQMHVSEEQLANVSVEDIGKSMGVELITFTQMMEDSDGNEVETICVYARQCQRGGVVPVIVDFLEGVVSVFLFSPEYVDVERVDVVFLLGSDRVACRLCLRLLQNEMVLQRNEHFLAVGIVSGTCSSGGSAAGLILFRAGSKKECSGSEEG